jgi:hypothetical protein
LFALDAWFVLDDYNWLRPFSLKDILAYFSQSWGHGSAYRPIMRVSFFVDYQLFGENPLGWHLHSYILHTLNASLLFLIVFFFNKKYTPAVITALLFTIAPWGHDNIAWISARTYSLASLFYLIALYSALLHVSTQRLSLLFFSSITLLIALMTYESSVSFAPILGLLLFFFRKPLELSIKRLFYIVLHFGLLTLLFLIVRYFILQGNGSLNANHAHYFQGLLINLDILKQITFYDYPFISMYVLSTFVLFMGLQWYRKTLKNTLYVGILLTALTLVSYLPFSQIGGVAYRFLYLTQIPYIYAISAIIYGLIQFEQQFFRKAIFSNILLLIILTGFAAASVDISKEWQVAGRLSKSIPEQFKQQYPSVPTGVNLVFQNIPDMYKRAGVFLTYFEYAIGRQYPSFTQKIFRAERLLQMDNFATKRPDLPGKYFIFHGDKLIELSQVQWEVFNGLRQYKITEANFDGDLYLKLNSDVAEHYARFKLSDNGWVHWSTHGKQEGRVALPRSIP